MLHRTRYSRKPTEITVPVEFGPLGELEVTVAYYYTPADPGRTSGPPEHCYPSEPSEIDYDSITCDQLNEAGNALLFKALTTDERYAPHLDEYIEEHECELQEEADADYADAVIESMKYGLDDLR